MNFNPYIYILYYQSNLLNDPLPTPISYPYEMKYFIGNGSVGTARTNLLNIKARRCVNDAMQMSITKERYWLTLTLLRLEVQSRSHDISMFCIEKCKQPEMLVSSKATTLRM